MRGVLLLLLVSLLCIDRECAEPDPEPGRGGYGGRGGSGGRSTARSSAGSRGRTSTRTGYGGRSTGRTSSGGGLFGGHKSKPSTTWGGGGSRSSSTFGRGAGSGFGLGGGSSRSGFGLGGGSSRSGFGSGGGMMSKLKAVGKNIFSKHGTGTGSRSKTSMIKKGLMAGAAAYMARKAGKRIFGRGRNYMPYGGRNYFYNQHGYNNYGGYDRHNSQMCQYHVQRDDRELQDVWISENERMQTLYYKCQPYEVCCGMECCNGGGMGGMMGGGYGGGYGGSGGYGNSYGGYGRSGRGMWTSVAPVSEVGAVNVILLTLSAFVLYGRY